MTDKPSQTEQQPTDASQQDVRILPPDYTIKKKIGMEVDIHQIFTPERIEAAQKSIDETQTEFVQWVHKDLTELEEAYQTLTEANGTAHPAAMDKTCKIAFSLKCQSGTFGYDLGSKVANSLYRYLIAHKDQPLEKERLTVLRKHIDALQVIFQQNILGEGDATGQELMDNLKRLVEKLG